MSNYQERIMDYEVTESVGKDHVQISEDEHKHLMHLNETNGELMDRWYGPAGEIFQQLASTIESELSNTIRFSDNWVLANDQLITNFTTADGTISEALEVEVKEN